MYTTVSIIVPVYNNEDTILRCLVSIYTQNWHNKEIIVVDDGSTDESYSICKKFAESHSNVILLSQEHAGQSAGRNLGLIHSHGDFICFCDADDELLPSALLDMIHSFDDSIDLVVGNVLKENSPFILSCRKESRYSAIRRFFRHDAQRLLGSVYGKIFRRSLIAPQEGQTLSFDETIHVGEDALFLLQYLNRCQYIYLNAKNVYVHYKNSNGIITSSRLSDYSTAIEASKKMIISVSNYANLKKLAIKDLFHTFIHITKRLSLSDNIIIRDLFISTLQSLKISLDIVNIPILEYNCDKLSLQRTSLYNMGSQIGENFQINATDFGIAIAPAFVNMHIHLEDYCSSQSPSYLNTDEFLSHKVIDSDINHNIYKNLQECEQEGTLHVAYTHKPKLSHQVVQILHLSKTVERNNNENGWMLCDILSYDLEQLLTIFALAKRDKCPIFFHLSSSCIMDARERGKYNGSFISFMAERDLMSEFCYVIHGSYLNEQELNLISENHSNIIICPISEYRGKENIISPYKLSERGVQWLLGTDSQALAGTSSILENAMFLKKMYNDLSWEEILYRISILPLDCSLGWNKPIERQFILLDIGHHSSTDNMVKCFVDKKCRVIGKVELNTL